MGMISIKVMFAEVTLLPSKLTMVMIVNIFQQMTRIQERPNIH